MTSITLGLVIIFALTGSGAVSTDQNTVRVAVNLALGAIRPVAAIVLGTGRDERIAERRQTHKAPQQVPGGERPPRWQQAPSQGTARLTFVAGAMLTLPGDPDLAGLNEIGKQEPSPTATVLTVIAFNLII